MSWFKKKDPQTSPEAEDNTPAPARNPDNVFLFRMLAVAYILYIVYKTISMYVAGGEDAPKLWMLCLSTVLLGGGAIFLGIISYRTWKKQKAQQQAEAEAALEDEDWEEEEEEL